MNVGRMNVGLASRPRPNFNHITGAGARAWLADAALSGLVLDWSGGDPRFNHWLRGRRIGGPVQDAWPSATFARAGARSAPTGLAGGTLFAANRAREVAGQGLRTWDAATNLVRQSDAMSTQTVTVTAVAHTLSFWGTGSVTLTGASTAGPLNGTGANNRVSLTFTPTAGSLTMTVSGSVTFAQLETGAVASDYIQNLNAGASQAADADNLQIPNSDMPSGTPLLIVCEFANTSPIDRANTNRIWSWTGPPAIFMRRESETVASITGVGGPTESIVVTVSTSPSRVAYLYQDGVAGRASANGGAVVVSSGTATRPANVLSVGGFATVSHNDYLSWLAVAPVSGTLSNAQLQAIASRA